ncbi:unnamed protein product [Pleuronectes platessa]|uniref:Uncharacterized protein n=1 Tax=Pleuronectes platessa TaxID=8262 RepID=A0A9N7UBL1_PLEPL|nr:unnamed protein product [Pleuronectes platessa]
MSEEAKEKAGGGKGVHRKKKGKKAQPPGTGSLLPSHSFIRKALHISPRYALSIPLLPLVPSSRVSTMMYQEYIHSGAKPDGSPLLPPRDEEWELCERLK